MGATFLAGLFACITAGNARAILLNVNSPETRGSAFAVYSLLDNLGKGFGPFMAASLIASLGSRTKAFNAAVCLWAICGLFLLRAPPGEALQILTSPERSPDRPARLSSHAFD